MRYDSKYKSKLPEINPRQDRVVYPLFDPKEAPIRGMVSALDPSALNQGEWPLLQNVRLGKRVIQVRGGTTSLSTILASGTFRGFWQGSIDGTEVILVGVKDGTDTKVYASTDASSWSEITAASGKYGATRFTDNGKLLTFEKVRQTFTTNAEMVLIQNGTDAPRVYYRGSTTLAKIEAISPPIEVRDTAVKIGLNAFLDMSDSGDTTYTVAAAGEMNLADAGASSTDNYIVLTIDTTVTNNRTASVTFGSGAAWGTQDQPKQLVLGVETAYADLWQHLMVEIGDAGAWQTVYDPTDDTYLEPLIVPMGPSKDFVVFEVEGLIPADTYDRVRFTWKGDAPGADQTVNIFLIGDSGRIRGGTSVGISYWNAGSQTQSPGVVLARYQPLRVRDLGGPQNDATYIPVHETVFYKYEIPYLNTDSTERDKGVAGLVIYLREVGSNQFYYYDLKTIATYAGSWSFSSGSAGEMLYYTLPYTLPSANSISQTLPSAYSQQIPTGRAMRYANGRLFVGSTGRLFFSDYQKPFQFLPFSLFDRGELEEDKGGMVVMESENIQAIAASAASTIGTATVYIFTERNLYATVGSYASQVSQVARVGPHGTPAPYSVQEIRGTVFWLDPEMQVRRLSGGGIDELTRRRVDDYLKGIPSTRREFVYGACFNDRYYLAFTPSGATTNTRIFVWEDEIGQWSLDIPPKACEGLVPWYDSKKFRLLMAGIDGSDLKAYEYDLDTATQDLGTNISVSLTTHELHSPTFDRKFHVRRIGALVDDVASGAFTITRTYKPTGGTGGSTLSIDVSANQAWRWDGSQTVTTAGNGAACQISFTGSLTGGSKIYRLVCEIQQRGKGADVA